MHVRLGSGSELTTSGLQLILTMADAAWRAGALSHWPGSPTTSLYESTEEEDTDAPSKCEAHGGMAGGLQGKSLLLMTAHPVINVAALVRQAKSSELRSGLEEGLSDQAGRQADRQKAPLRRRSGVSAFCQNLGAAKTPQYKLTYQGRA